MIFFRKNAHLVLAALVAVAASNSYAAEPVDGTAVTEKLKILEARVQELEAANNENWLTEQRSSQIRQVVENVLADAQARSRTADGPDYGYNNGFYLQTPDQRFKLSINGYAQFRYTFANQRQANIHVSPPIPQGKVEDANGFDIRRARITFSGNAFSPDIFFKFEGDFYGGSNLATAGLATPADKVQTSSSSGNFTVTDAYLGYHFTDLLQLRAGSFKVPFTKVEQVLDARLSFMERPEANTPFDAQRAIGLSLFGDIWKDKLNYEININNGSNSNILRRVDANNSNTTGPVNFNYDNRLAYYARVNWAGSGLISEFFRGESDLRTDRSELIWMLGAAGGYESQNSTNGAAFSQNTLQILGLGANNSPGFGSAYVVNGAVFRATIDFSAKWQGWALNTAAYFQEINAASSAGLPAGYTKNTSFFEHGYYLQIGYMLVPQRFEVLGRANYLLTSGDSHLGEYYSLGANYYLFGNNAKISGDVTYSPEAAFSDSSDTSIQNTREIMFRLQLQLTF